MTARKLFVIFIRLFFVLFSLKFLYDAFYRWDGYSFYIRFSEILPDVSFAFILWTVSTLILTAAFWIVVYVSSRVVPHFIKAVRFEHVAAWFIFAAILFTIKKFLNISLGDIGNSNGINKVIILLTIGAIITVIVWMARNFIKRNTDRILCKVNELITPLVWIFSLLIAVSVLSSLFLFFRGPVAADDTSEIAQSDILDNEQHPNIILLTMDALSAEDMELYGYHLPTTPFISKWARDAIVFKRAYSSSNWTPPTTMTMMTGQRPWIHKNWHLTYNWPYRKYEQNLPDLLKKHGYATYAFVQNYNAHPNALGVGYAFSEKDEYYTFRQRAAGFEGGLYDFINHMEDFTRSRIAIGWLIRHPLFSPVWSIFPTDKEKTVSPPEVVYDRFLDVMKEKTRRPFFAWIHLEIPHYPFLPPKPYMGMFGNAEQFNTEHKQNNSRLLGQEYDLVRQDEVDILKVRQDEFIYYADQAFKSFLSRLEDTIDTSKTIIMLSADHGTSMTRGLVGHGFHWLYENITHIPLIIKIPEPYNLPEIKINNRVIDIPVEQVDVAPTILDFAGIPVPEWMEGRSLLPLVEGKYFERRPVLSMELGGNRAVGDHQLSKYSIAVWEGFYKLMYHSGWEDKDTELYNLSSDPDETENIVHKEPEIAQRLLKVIEKKLAQFVEK